MSPPPAEQHVAALIEWNRRDAGIDQGSTTPHNVRNVGIVGAGMMGVAIAAANLKHHVPVVLHDPDENALATARQRIAAELTEGDGLPDLQIRESVERLVTLANDEVRVAACDLVIESIPENASLKQGLYSRLEPHLGPEAVLTSNTSTIPIARLAQKLAQRGRFCGLHFFHPVRRRPLVEIIRGSETHDETIATAVAYAKQIGKMPVVVADGPGFLVNRLLMPYLTEALELLLDGASIETVENTATRFGMAMGPLRLLDEIGLDTTLLGGRVLWEAFPERIVASPLLIAMYKAGRLGRKAGLGFFFYPKGLPLDQPGQPDPSVEAIIAKWAREPQNLSDETIMARLFLPMIVEATRILAEKRVRGPRDIDLGVLFGLGFPVSRGGLLYWADTLGPKRLLSLLQPLESLGERAQPTPMLLEMAAEKRGYYGTQ